MMGEVSRDVNVHLTALVEHSDDAAVTTVDAVLIGSPRDESTLRQLARNVDVVTFDHELVDLELLERLESEGVVFAPAPSALRFAVDKAHQRTELTRAGLPVPRFVVVNHVDDPRLSDFLQNLDRAPVVKVPRGGYDGRGVFFPHSESEARQLIANLCPHGDVLVEQRLDLLSECAQIVARRANGEMALFALVDTVQSNGMCVEVTFPTSRPDLADAANRLSADVATIVQPVGVMAVEYFVTGDGLVINEVALRPHNTGHWTIEGTVTSQFAQHLLAVSGQPLGSPSPLVGAAAMVNVVGSSSEGSLEDARATSDVYVHDYGKAWRPGRKLGHVTAVGDRVTVARERAWAGARALKTAATEVVR